MVEQQIVNPQAVRAITSTRTQVDVVDANRRDCDTELPNVVVANFEAKDSHVATNLDFMNFLGNLSEEEATIDLDPDLKDYAVHCNLPHSVLFHVRAAIECRGSLHQLDGTPADTALKEGE